MMNRIRQALSIRTFSKDVVVNLLHRRRYDAPSKEMELSEPLQLREPPVADCQRYDTLLKEHHHVA